MYTIVYKSNCSIVVKSSVLILSESYYRYSYRTLILKILKNICLHKFKKSIICLKTDLIAD